MAVPTIDAVTTGTSWTAGASQYVTVSAPAGMGSGDLDLIMVGADGWSASPVHAITSGDAYTTIHNDYHLGDTRFSAFRRISGASPITTVVRVAEYNAQWVIVRLRLTGVDQVTPIHAIGAIVTGSAAPSDNPFFTIPAVTATQDNTLALLNFVWRSGNINGSRPNSLFTASSWTNIYNDFGGSSINSPACFFARKDMAAAGSTGNAVVSCPAFFADAVNRPYIGRLFLVAGESAPPVVATYRIITPGLI